VTPLPGRESVDFDEAMQERADREMRIVLGLQTDDDD